MVRIAKRREARRTSQRRRQKKRLTAYDIYQLFVGEIGFNRREFLFELQFWEIRRIISGYRRRDRTAWLSTRWQTYYILCALGAKLNKPEDLQKFSWDDEEKEQNHLSDEEVDELQALIAATNAELRSTSAIETNGENEKD